MGQLSNPGGLIRNAGLRATKPRIAVLHALASARRPLGIRELSLLLSSPIDTVTLYRMMNDFTKAGIVSKIELGRGHATYELRGNDDHHHIICTACEKIEDFEDTEHETLAKRAVKRSKSFSQLTGHSFELYGLCNMCSVQ